MQNGPWCNGVKGAVREHSYFYRFGVMLQIPIFFAFSIIVSHNMLLRKELIEGERSKLGWKLASS